MESQIITENVVKPGISSITASGERKNGAIPLPESSTDIRSATEGNEKRRKDMHYVIGDIHNDLKKLKQILKQINITGTMN